MIRLVRHSDAAAILEIYNHYIAETTATFDTDPLSLNEMEERIISISSAFPYFVCEKDGRVVGFCYAHFWKEKAAYSATLETTVYLRPDLKHCGIGTGLMSRLIDDCRNRGFRVLIACITAENTESIEFHRHLGFIPVSHFRNVGFKFNRALDVIDLEFFL